MQNFLNSMSCFAKLGKVNFHSTQIRTRI